MADLAKFKEELASYAERHNGLPNVVLSQGTDVGQAFSCVAGVDNQADNESIHDLVGRYVDEFCNTLNSEDYKGTVEVFDRTVAAFADKIKDALSSLDGVRTTARELAGKAEKIANEVLNQSEFYNKYVNYSEMSTNFPEFVWGATKVWGTKEALASSVNALVTASGVDPSDQFDIRLFNIIASGLDRFVKAEPVALDEAARTALIDQLKAILPDASETCVCSAVDRITGMVGTTDICNLIAQYKTLPAADIFNTIKTIDAFVLDNQDVVDAIVSQQVKADEKVQSALVASATKLQNLCKILAYYEQMQRDTVYREAYLLQGGLINSDQQAAFVSAGGTPKMVANYIRKFYNDDYSTIPAMGVRADAIVKADGTIADEVEEMNKTTADKIKLIKTNANVSAFKIVALEYIEQQYKLANSDEAVDPAKRSVFVDKVMTSTGCCVIDAIRQYNICPVEAFITLVIGTSYTGTFVEHLQKKLGSAYLALTNLNTTVSEDDIRCAEAGVIAELIISFVVDKMVCNSAPATKAEIKTEPGAQPAQEG